MKEINENFNEKKSSLPFEIKFYPDKATMILKINSQAPDLETKRAEAEKRGLLAKKEFHFTVIGSDTGEEILKLIEGLSEAEKKEKLDEIKELGESIDWKLGLKEDFYYVKKEYNDPSPNNPEVTIPETRQSIIQTGEVGGIKKFYKKLNALLGQQFDIPPAHLTLYTTSTREDKKSRGIGIYSKNDFKNLHPEKI